MIQVSCDRCGVGIAPGRAGDASVSLTLSGKTLTAELCEVCQATIYTDLAVVLARWTEEYSAAGLGNNPKEG